ncbi:MAG: ParB/RepB/Spo0J family partition protein [Acidobacteria bacterium]|nr:ParB/RepB/Spo0J family partition protein [Acidobacteriota bacterium]
MSNATDQPRKALGRGLSALLPANRNAAPVQPPIQAPGKGKQEAAAADPAPLRIPTDSIAPNPLQPRTVFQEERLAELAQSIRENGIIQPLVVRKVGEGYQLIAGERRLRAAKIAGLAEIPVVIQNFADDRLMEITLIENIQREDLNPIEVAHAFERLAREHHLSHEQIALRTGKDRSTITNMLRLLRLPSEVQLLLAEQRISMGHARAILGLPEAADQSQLAEKVAQEGLSVRQVEKQVQKMIALPDERPTKEEPPIDPNVKAAIQELERVLGTRVRIVPKNDKRGRIEIEYYTQDELSRIYDVIVGE